MRSGTKAMLSYLKGSKDEANFRELTRMAKIKICGLRREKI